MASGVSWVLEGWAERRPGWCQQEAGYFWVGMVPLAMDWLSTSTVTGMS